jgi:hypothetical protein
MRKRIFEDLIINKLNGYYLFLFGHELYYTSELIFIFTQMLVTAFVFARLIPPRRRS